MNYQHVNKIYFRFLGRSVYRIELYNFIKNKLTLNDIVNQVANSIEYLNHSKKNLNKLARKVLRRHLTDTEFKYYFEILKQNGNNIDMIEKLISNIKTNKIIKIIKNIKNIKPCFNQKITALYKDILNRTPTEAELIRDNSKIRTGSIILKDIEYELLETDECAKIVENQIELWITETCSNTKRD